MHHGVVKLRITSGRIDGQMICGPVGDNGSNMNDVTCTQGSIVDSWTISSGQTPDTTPPAAVTDLAARPPRGPAARAQRAAGAHRNP